MVRKRICEKGGGSGSQLDEIIVLDSPTVSWAGVVALVEHKSRRTAVFGVEHWSDALAELRGTGRKVVICPADGAGSALLSLMLQIKARCRNCRILVLGDEPDPGEFLELARVPIDGYLTLAHLSAFEFEAALKLLGVGEVSVWSLPALDTLLTAANPPAYQWALSCLTSDEFALLEGLSKGMRQSQIAEQEHLSERTVRRRTRSLRGRFGVRTQAELKRIASTASFRKAES